MGEAKQRWSMLTHPFVVASSISVGLYIAGAIRNHSRDYDYMIWNLFLAWLPLLLVFWLLRVLRTKRWSSWQGIALSILWLGFLPNSFYMVTDYIHLADTVRVDVLYDALMLTSFVLTGLALGYTSLFLFHLELRKRLPARSANHLVSFILLLCSGAIYLGRDLRWNTWDLFVNPAGILFDVSDRFINPRAHPQMFITIITVFVVLVTFYYLLRVVAHTLRTSAQPE